LLKGSEAATHAQNKIPRRNTMKTKKKDLYHPMRAKDEDRIELGQEDHPVDPRRQKKDRTQRGSRKDP